MRRLVFPSLLTLLLLSGSMARAELPYLYELPHPDARGDYREVSHLWWRVVDPDQAGLNARLCKDEDQPLKGADLRSLPVARRLPRGTVLTKRDEVLDSRGQPWLVVHLYEPTGGPAYYLRANRQFLEPIHNPPPRVDAQGNYRGDAAMQHFWKVVDPDPSGLNARLSPDFPGDVSDIRAQWPRTTPDRWPVVERLPGGTIVRAVHGNRGAIILKGSDGQPWLLVSTTLDARQHRHQRIFFVRLNLRYLQPVY